MPAKRKVTKEEISYPGVYWRTDQKGVKTYYIRYRLDYIPEGRTSNEVNEKAGRGDKGMTAAKASNLRADRMRGKADPNAVKRVKERAAKEAAAGRWDINKIWTEYDEAHKDRACAKPDASYFSYILPELGDKIPADLVTLDLERLRRNLAKTKSLRTKPSQRRPRSTSWPCSSACCAGRPTWGTLSPPPTSSSRCLPWTTRKPSS